ncbi:MAG: hypothetical protein J6K50_03605 [Clostridia bacterium]|nr:hypothetical protein [Clostridia bacterium]
MKLEKREITLNEFDSLKDIFYLEKTLLSEYVEALSKATRRETQSELTRLIKETSEDLYFVRDLMRGSAIENGGNEE